tara:strand:- start:15 stop:320 length:306 start_codon:yes stop_codon:yes gene_type:complete
MSANPTQKQNWFHANQLTQSFQTTGQYFGARTIAASAGSVDVTDEGYGAILIGDVTNLFITASNGTVVPTAQFDTKTIYDIGIKGIKVGATGNCTIFKRQQ